MTDEIQTDHSNSLAELAARINAEHTEVVHGLKAGIEHGIQAGVLLIEAKQQLKHGHWLLWLEKHCLISERTAQLYMRLAKYRVEIEFKSETVADLTLRSALALIANPSDRSLAAIHETLIDAEAAFVAAGEKLVAQKASMRPSEWRTWLKDNARDLGFGEMTAKLLIKLAADPTNLDRHLDVLEAKGA